MSNEHDNLSNSVQLLGVITAEDLLAKWVGVTEDQFADMIESGRPIPYKISVTRTNLDGIDIYFCKATRYMKALATYKNGTKKYVYSGIVFSKIEVDAMEQATPELTWQMKGPREVQLTQEERDGTAFQTVDCSTLPKRWECDILDVLIIFSLGSCDLRYGNTGTLHAPLTVEDIYSMDVILSDLLKWEAEHRTILECLKSKAKGASTLHGDPKKITARIAQLQSDNETLRNTIAQIKESKKCSPATDSSKTANANSAIQGKAAKAWEVDLTIAVALTAELAEIGKPNSTTEHEGMWEKRHNAPEGSNPRRDAFRAFRRALPDKLKHENKAKIKKSTDQPLVHLAPSHEPSV